MHGAERTAEFDRAMAELQRGLWIAKVEEVYDPDFYYRWDLLTTGCPSHSPRRATSVARRRASSPLRLPARGCRRTGANHGEPSGCEPAEVEAGLAALERDGAVRQGQRIRGLPGLWTLWAGGASGG